MNSAHPFPLILLFAIFALTGCGKKSEIFYHDNGKRKIEIQYFKNGQKRSEANYFENKLDGLYTTWHENGELRSQSTYSMGKVDGLLIHWHENGQKKVNTHLKMASSLHVQNHGTMKEC